MYAPAPAGPGLPREEREDEERISGKGVYQLLSIQLADELLLSGPGGGAAVLAGST